MPKMKTKSGAKKRFKVTKNKKFKYARAGRRHLLESKSSGQSRAMRKLVTANAANEGQLRQMMPYA